MRVYFALSILFCVSTWSMGEAPLSVQQERYQYLIENDPELAEIYKTCSKNDPENTSDCLWKTLGEKDPDKQTQLKQAISQRDQGNAERPHNKDEFKFISGNDSIKLSEQERDSVTALQDHLKKNLEKVLYGENNLATNQQQQNQPTNAAFGTARDVRHLGREDQLSHHRFHDLFESQLGKNIVTASSNYCIQADSNGNVPEDEDDRKANRRKNLKDLSDFSQDPDIPVAYTTFTACITSLPDQCTSKKDDSCLVLDYIQKAKKSILLTQEIKEEWQKRQPGSSDQDGTAFSINDAINVTSGQIEESDFTKEAQKEALLLENCKTDYNKFKDQCDQYLRDAEELENEKIEMEVRRTIMHSKIAEIDNEDEFEKYLMEEGYTEKRIGEILEGNWKEERDKIAALYEAQTQAIKSDMTERLNRLESGDQTADFEDKFAKIQNDLVGSVDSKTKELTLDSKPEVLKQVVHFANIINGYHCVEDCPTDKNPNKDYKKNTASLLAELDYSAFSQSGASRSNASMELGLREDHFDQIKRSAGPGSSDSDVKSGTRLSAEQINNVFSPLEKKKNSLELTETSVETKKKEDPASTSESMSETYKKYDQ